MHGIEGGPSWDNQRPDGVRRSAPGNGSQSRGDRLDRGAAEKLRLPDRRASNTNTKTPPNPRRRTWRAGTRRRGGRRPASRRRARGPASTPTRCSSPTRSCATLNAQPTTPGPREEVYCTKVGTTRPDEMYIVGAHMDGHGWGEAANDDGSGTALVMELARVFNSPDVHDRANDPLRLWNNEETGLNGSARLRRAAAGLQGKEDPPGLGTLPGAEMARHDPARHDAVRSRHAARRRHGEPRAAARSRRQHRVPGRTRRWPPSRRRWRGSSHAANEKYATDYPAAVGRHMTNTDSAPFMDIVAGDQPARERARHADRQRLGSALAPADRCLRHVFGQGFPPRPERRADDAGRRCPARRRDPSEARRTQRSLRSQSQSHLRPLRSLRSQR